MTRPKPFAFTLLCAGVTAISIFIGCTKDPVDPPAPTPVCDVRGVYSGIYTNQFDQSGTVIYSLKEDNFTTGVNYQEGPTVAFGGYSNTCDSVTMNYYNIINSSYYIFQGAFSVTKDTLSGSYQNLTTPSEIGTFFLVKE